MVNLTHENSLLQEINNLSASGKIGDSVALTALTGQSSGSKLTAQAAESEIQKLIPTIRQRLSAAKFYLDAIENMNYAPYLERRSSLSEDQKPLIDFSDIDLYVQINLLNPDAFPLVVFILLNGFFSNLVSLEDCVAKIISVLYDLPMDDKPGYIRKALNNKMPNGKLTLNLRAFHAIDQNEKLDPTGSPFNIASEIRHQLIHGDIAEIVFFPSWSLLGFPSDIDLYFNNSFFPDGTVPKYRDTEMIVFCEDVYKKTVDFVNECYKLICDDLQRNGAFPV
ncbi:MAG: hypothetical protein OXH00_21795 [Candidatus Poribacteria bacterium]|nr:hypothetical protein [Candidatus Poribacteria bacterium]